MKNAVTEEIIESLRARRAILLAEVATIDLALAAEGRPAPVRDSLTTKLIPAALLNPHVPFYPASPPPIQYTPQPSPGRAPPVIGFTVTR